MDLSRNEGEATERDKEIMGSMIEHHAAYLSGKVFERLSNIIKNKLGNHFDVLSIYELFEDSWNENKIVIEVVYNYNFILKKNKLALDRENITLDEYKKLFLASFEDVALKGDYFEKIHKKYFNAFASKVIEVVEKSFVEARRIIDLIEGEENKKNFSDNLLNFIYKIVVGLFNSSSFNEDMAKRLFEAYDFHIGYDSTSEFIYSIIYSNADLKAFHMQLSFDALKKSSEVPPKEGFGSLLLPYDDLLEALSEKDAWKEKYFVTLFVDFLEHAIRLGSVSFYPTADSIIEKTKKYFDDKDNKEELFDEIELLEAKLNSPLVYLLAELKQSLVTLKAKLIILTSKLYQLSYNLTNPSD